MLDRIPWRSACRCLFGLGLVLAFAAAGFAQEAASTSQLVQPPAGSAVTPPGDTVQTDANPSRSIIGPFPFLLDPRPEELTREGNKEEGERERDEIETDRDSFTPATKLAGQGRCIVESAYSYIENRGVAATHSFPEFLVRYGWTDWLELRLGWNYEIGGARNNVSGTDAGDESSGNLKGLERESTFNYGVKFLLTRPDGWVPRSAVILQGSSPTSGKATDTELVATYVFGWELPNRWLFDAAMRYGTGTEETDHFSNWAPSAVLKVPVGEKWNVHVEYFGIFSTGKDQESVQHYFSSGAHYLITSNLEVGVRLGCGLNDQSARFFSNVGVGWRF